MTLVGAGIQKVIFDTPGGRLPTVHVADTPAVVIIVGVVALMIGAIVRHVRMRRRAKSARDRFTQSETHYRLPFESNPCPMWVYDLSTAAIVEVNDAAVAQYGYSREEFATMTVRDLRAPEEAARLDDMLREANRDVAVMYLARHRRKNSTQIDVEVRGHPLPIGGRALRLVVVTDCTDRAGGVAHDFNKLLTIILSYSEMLLIGDHPAVGRDDIEEISLAARRATALTSQLLTFSRKAIVQLRPVDVNVVVSGMHAMFRRLLMTNIELTITLTREPCVVAADPSQLEQILMNFIGNASDAMPEGGSLAIETQNVELDDAYVRSHAGVEPGPYVMLAVTDTGVGMDAATASKVFEPFFTTKGVGRGTGLGLATVYAITKQLDGHVWVYSEPRHGTTFKGVSSTRCISASSGNPGGEARRIAGAIGHCPALRGRRRRSPCRAAHARATGLYGSRGARRRGRSRRCCGTRGDHRHRDYRSDDAENERRGLRQRRREDATWLAGCVRVGVHGRHGGATRPVDVGPRVPAEAVYRRPAGAGDRQIDRRRMTPTGARSSRS